MLRQNPINQRKENLRIERLSWFSEEPINEVLEKNNLVYFKHWDGNKKRWTVSEFTSDSWARMKGIRKDKNEEIRQASLELENKNFED